METAVHRITEGSSVIHKVATVIEERRSALLGNVAELFRGFEASAANLSEADKRFTAMPEACESLITRAVGAGVEMDDTRRVEEVRRVAGEVSRTIEQAVETGVLTLGDVFDHGYKPVAGSNPGQFTTRYVDTFDRLLTPILDGALNLDPRIGFCAPVDVNGYLPTP